MRKLAGLFILLLVTYAIYHDLSAGTLPSDTTSKIDAAEKLEKKESIAPYFEHEVKPGDTVLSILDNYSTEPLAVPVSTAIEDFKKLNDGIEPQKIKFGETYRFPDYSKDH